MEWDVWATLIFPEKTRRGPVLCFWVLVFCGLGSSHRDRLSVLDRLSKTFQVFISASYRQRCVKNLTLQCRGGLTQCFQHPHPNVRYRSFGREIRSRSLLSLKDVGHWIGTENRFWKHRGCFPGANESMQPGHRDGNTHPHIRLSMMAPHCWQCLMALATYLNLSLRTWHEFEDLTSFTHLHKCHLPGEAPSS